MKKLLIIFLLTLTVQNVWAGKSAKDLALFYKKFKVVNGLTIKGSDNIDVKSLETASTILEKMLSKRPDIRARLVAERADIAIIAQNENFCDIPELNELKKMKTFDGRDYCSLCGGGGIPGRPITAICEDNLLKTRNDPYHKREDILTHEYAHTIHLVGMSREDSKKLKEIYKATKKLGTFEKNSFDQPTYMMANEEEFFACLTAIWFKVNDPLSPAVSPLLPTREAIKEKMPEMYEFMLSIYPTEETTKEVPLSAILP